MPSITRENQLALERELTAVHGYSRTQLVERMAFYLPNALQAVATLGVDAHSVLVVCGPGMVGATGLSLACLLANNPAYSVEVAFIGDPSQAAPETLALLQDVRGMGLVKSLDRCDLDAQIVVDAIIGIGINRPLDGDMVEGVEFINAFRDRSAMIVALDIPSGMNCEACEPFGEHCVRAHRTIGFHCYKKAFEDDRAMSYGCHNSRTWLTGYLDTQLSGELAPALYRKYLTYG